MRVHGLLRFSRNTVDSDVDERCRVKVIEKEELEKSEERHCYGNFLDLPDYQGRKISKKKTLIFQPNSFFQVETFIPDLDERSESFGLGDKWVSTSPKFLTNWPFRHFIKFFAAKNLVKHKYIFAEETTIRKNVATESKEKSIFSFHDYFKKEACNTLFRLSRKTNLSPKSRKK